MTLPQDRAMVAVRPTQWWHKDEGQGQIVCDLCPRECKLHEGQRGFCFVRQNVGDEMLLTTYGRSSGFCIDPIEKKPLNHFLPGTPVLSFGTAGCNLGCKFCQNWSISKSREIDTLADDASPEAIADAAKCAGCRSVAFTYNDPVIWAEYAIDTARACHAVGLKTVAVTAGYITPEARGDFYEHMDAANVDLKGFTEEFYRHVTLSHLEPVLDTLRWLKHESNVWFEITNLMIPGENDSEDETRQMCDWIVKELGPDVPTHFTAFHPDFRMMDKPHTPQETLLRAREIALAAGMHYPYVGNTHHVAGQSTWCPNCGQRLIERDWYELGDWKLNGSQCGRCGTTIAGVFENEPGDWGSRRQPIRISPPVVPLSIPKKPSPTPAEGKPTMIAASPRPTTAASTTAPPTMPSPKIDFSGDETADIVAHARAVAEAVLGDRSPPLLPADLANSPAYGLFVTFRRNGMLRACRGRFGTTQPLGSLLCDVVRDTVLDDPRFPALTSVEVPYLHIDVSLMFGPQPVTVPPAERVKAIQIGRHGLVLSHEGGRGLLLPQVAAEAGWDAERFLQGVSQKSGLSADGWRNDSTQLMTFEARVLDSPPLSRETDWSQLTPDDFERLRDIVEFVAERSSQSAADLSSLLTSADPTGVALAVHTLGGRVAASIGVSQSLAQLAASLGKSLHGDAEAKRISRITVLGQPIVLRPQDHPHRHDSLARAAIVSQRGAGWSLQLPETPPPTPPIRAALQALDTDFDQWKADPEIRVTAFTAIRGRPIKPRTELVRPAFRAGQFYPQSPEAIRSELSKYLDETPAERRTVRAVLLPHAGWIYCGRVIGQTLARTHVPKTVVVIGPKHTPLGANWSVSSANVWEYPGGKVSIATESRDRLVSLVPGLADEADAHRQEHAVEVLVPFLHRCQPDLRLLPIVIGPTSYAQTERLARGLSILLSELDEPVLLVVSSDLNHFAAEAENRRRDELAIEAFCSGDPGGLFDTVSTHDISMCGVMPAVTILRTLHEQKHPPRPELVLYANSAAVSGDTSRVVGYAGCMVP